jgi:hypothetical protein
MHCGACARSNIDNESQKTETGQPPETTDTTDNKYKYAFTVTEISAKIGFSKTGNKRVYGPGIFFASNHAGRERVILKEI